MHKSFRYPEPSRLDLAVHLSLGLAALMAVVFALGATFDFCSRLDGVVGWFSSDFGSTEVSAPGQPESRPFTNAAGSIQPWVQAGPAAANRSAVEFGRARLERASLRCPMMNPFRTAGAPRPVSADFKGRAEKQGNPDWDP